MSYNKPKKKKKKRSKDANFSSSDNKMAKKMVFIDEEDFNKSVNIIQNYV